MHPDLPITTGVVPSDEIIRLAVLERDLMIRKNPSMQAFQAEIDRRLDMAGSPENRMAVLAVMMEASLLDLRECMRDLAAAAGNRQGDLVSASDLISDPV